MVMLLMVMLLFIIVSQAVCKLRNVMDAQAVIKSIMHSVQVMYHNVGRRYVGMARMHASRNTFSKPPNSQTKKL